MKKALIILTLSLILSAGLYFNPAHGINAAVAPAISEPGKSGTSAYFYTDDPDLKYAIIEYTFLSNGVYMSKLKTYEITLNAQNTTQTINKFSFTLPAEALAFKVWRVITHGDYIKSVSGLNVYVNGTYSMDGIELRLKTLYIYDDLITREQSIGSVGTLLTPSKQFYMHFSVVDAMGEEVPIDEIHSIRVEYDIVRTFVGLIDTRTHVEKTIQATENRSLTVWPFIYPAHVVTNIKESTHLRDDNIVGNEIYDWMVDLGAYDYTWPASSVNLDQTTILTIDYYYDGVFYQDAEVVDEPYDVEDIIDVIPGTTTPIDTLWNKILEWILANPETAIMIVGALIAIVIIGKILSTIKILVDLLKSVLKSVWWVVKTIFIGIYYFVYYVLKFIFVIVPKGIGKFIYFLFVPYDRRQLKERNVIEYANRSI